MIGLYAMLYRTEVQQGPSAPLAAEPHSSLISIKVNRTMISVTCVWR